MTVPRDRRGRLAVDVVSLAILAVTLFIWPEVAPAASAMAASITLVLARHERNTGRDSRGVK